MTASPAASGSVAAGFEGVRAAFERNLSEHGETGGAFAAVVAGELVVDLWGGLADPRSGRPWGPRTCAVVFSGTKGVIATALLLLVERGRLELSAPVSDLWPEFAAAGKADVTVEQLCSHCGGVAGVAGPLELGDQAAIARALAAQAPIVPIGAPCYHALTYGWLAAELIRRADGRSAGGFVRDELAGDLDLRIGLAPGDELAAERAELRLAPGFRLGAFASAQLDPRLELVYCGPPLTPGVWNDPAMLALEVPAAGAVATARALATLYGRLVAGAGPLGERALELGRRPVAAGDDPISKRPLRFGPTGYELAGTPSALGPPGDAFGHTGAGGSSHGAWASLQTGFSYVTAELRSESEDERARRVLGALHESVAR